MLQQIGSMLEQPFHDCAKGIPASVAETVEQQAPLLWLPPSCLQQSQDFDTETMHMLELSAIIDR